MVKVIILAIVDSSWSSRICVSRFQGSKLHLHHDKIISKEMTTEQEKRKGSTSTKAAFGSCKSIFEK